MIAEPTGHTHDFKSRKSKILDGANRMAGTNAKNYLDEVIE